MTLDELRAKYPSASEADLAKALALINLQPQPIEKIWESENDVADSPKESDADGLTRPMRELNAFAEEHAMPIPFPVRRR